MPARSSEELFNKIKLLFSSPSVFFSKIKDEGIQNALLTYIITFLVSQVVGAIIAFSFIGIASQSGSSGYMSGMFGYGASYPLIYFITIPLYVALALLFAFGFAGMIFLSVKAFKGSGGYTNSFKAVAYSLTPYNIISIIPFVGSLSIFYSLFLTTVGVKTLHNLSTGKAVAAVMLPILALLALLVVFVLMVLFAFRGVF